MQRNARVATIRVSLKPSYPGLLAHECTETDTTAAATQPGQLNDVRLLHHKLNYGPNDIQALSSMASAKQKSSRQNHQRRKGHKQHLL